MEFEEEYVETLYNIESNIVKLYQEKPDLIDSHIETAISYLIRVYNAEVEGRHAPRNTVRGKASDVIEHIQALCELLLGRLDAEDLEGSKISFDLKPTTAAEITACLKKLKSSLKVWTKQGGRQGYLNYVTQFINQSS